MPERARPLSPFGQQLRHWRERCGVSQVLLAAQARTSDDEKRTILEVAEARRRQVMNMRQPTARMLRVKDGERIVAWVGVDIDHDPVHPELFSMWIEPEYRAFGLSRIMRLALTTFFLREGITGFFGRIAVSEDREALAYWLASGAGRAVPEAAVGERFSAMCETCNLYGQECTERVYMLASTAKLHADDRRRVGAVDLARLPRMLDLAPPVVVAAAMNTSMWNHPAVTRNVAQLRRDGVYVVEPTLFFEAAELTRQSGEMYGAPGMFWLGPGGLMEVLDAVLALHAK